MSPELRTFFAGAEAPLRSFDLWCKQHLPAGRVDHIGYKCGSREEFESLREQLESASAYIYQSFISGRRIAIIKLQEALATELGSICFLELSDQKPDGSQVSGFDHLEIYPVEQDFTVFVKGLIEKGIPFEQTVRPHHTTYDAKLTEAFKIRLEEEPLIKKIAREEIF